MTTNLLLNPSFEERDENGPLHWRFSGAPDSREATLAAPEAHDGACAIMFTRLRGSFAWTSDSVAVKPQADYGLTWWTKTAGEEPWHWSYYAEHWVRIFFLDERGRQVGRAERRLRCIGSDGWVQGWLKCRAPQAAQAARVQFFFCCDIETDGQALIDDACFEEIVPLQPSPEHAVLRCRMVEEATGAPLLARCYVRPEGGDHLVPKYCYWAQVDGLAFHPLAPEFELQVPAGKGQVECVRGLEYEICRTQYQAASGEIRELTLPMRRRFDLPSRGWLGGDQHHHLFFHRGTRHPQMTIDDVMAIAQGEGLNFLSFQGEITELLAHLHQHPTHRAEGFVGEVGLETVSDFYGHMSQIYVTALPEYQPLNGQSGMPMHRVTWPPNVTVVRHMRERGGASVYCHPLDGFAPGAILEGIADGKKMLCAREWPIDLALGETPGWDLICEEQPDSHKHKMQEYYRMLNLGFRFGVTGSTDYYCDQACGYPGANRTYCHADSLDFASIAAAYRRGATFCTNGPLLLLKVNEAEPGDEVRLKPDDALRVSVEGFSLWGIGRVEIVVNGQVVHTFPADEEGKVTGAFEFRPERSCWLCARAFGPGHRLVHMRDIAEESRTEEGQFAHTSPVYLTVEDKPLLPKREDALYYAGWVEAAMQAVEARSDLFAKDVWGSKPNPEALKRRVLEEFERARQVFLSLAEQRPDS